MFRNMKKIHLFLISICLFLPSKVLANTINSINMDIYVDSNGNAHVVEKWDTTTSENTEFYKSYYNLGEASISNFSVKMNDQPFTNINWNINSSFSDKAYKDGYNYANDGVELCFGISKYGRNTYELNYDINNFIMNTQDGYQILYWTLIMPSSDPINNVYIKVYSDFAYSNTLDVWGFGKYGAPTYVYDGYIEMTSDGKMASDEYMTILVKFPQNTFSSEVNLDKTFDEYMSLAEEGATSYSANKSGIFPEILLYLFIFVSFVSFMIPVVIIVMEARYHTRYGTYKLNFGQTKNKVKKDVPYFREIPYSMDNFDRAYWISCQYSLIKKETDYLGAILLKWLKLGNITIKKTESKEEKTIIIFNNCSGLNDREIELYQIMYKASGDGILERKEFEKWCNKNYTKIFKWFNNVIDDQSKKLIKENILIPNAKKKKVYDVNPSMMIEAEKLAGLKKFLNDFSNIKDKSAIEVHLWNEYLMYASIFGIAKKVAKEFKDLYPEVITEEIYSNINFIYLVSYNGMAKATTARDRANSYSSGGGGFSSGGGGGGSFGGGGSMGSR